LTCCREEQRRAGEGQTEERRIEEKGRLEKGRMGIGHAERSCLMRTLDLRQIRNEKGRLSSTKIETWRRWVEDKEQGRNDYKTVEEKEEEAE